MMLTNQLGGGSIVTHFVVAPRRRNKITGHRLGALMQQLIKRVLGIGPDFAPQHRAGAGGYRLAVAGHRFAVGFHFQLRQKGRQMFQATIIGQHRMGMDAQNVGIPDTDQGHQYRYIFRPGRRAKMLIHLMGAGQQFAKTFHANAQRNGQTNGRPQRKTSTHPIPQGKLISGGNAPLRHLLDSGRHTNKVTADHRRRGAQCALQPGPRGAGVIQGIDGGKGLGGNNKKRAVGTQLVEQVGQLTAVHGRHEVDAHGAFIRCIVQRLTHHHGPHVGATHSDVHHIGNHFPGDAPPLPRMDTLHQSGHTLQLLLHLLLHRRGLLRWHTQGPMHGGALFRVVNGFAGKQAIDPATHITGIRQAAEQVERLDINTLLAQIQQQGSGAAG